MPSYDAIVIGAGLSGMYQLYRLRALGMSVRVFEAGGDVGGTWYWNRYPGARFDSESYSYGFSFSQEILDEWEWSEHFAAQPENLRYCSFVADKLDLRKDIQFNTRVSAATFDEEAPGWVVELAGGDQVRSRLLITAVGPLSTPAMPNVPGIEDFEGFSSHTGLWPHEPVDFRGKRVAVIGTGATGVQVIQEVAKTAGTLTVFQRSPNWCTPLHNSPIDAETQKQIHERYPEIFAICRQSHGAFMHMVDDRNALDLTEAERTAFYEKRYAEPGFGIWMGNFRDVLVDAEANRTLSEFVAGKIRKRVQDPAVAEQLIPTDHGFGTRRVPMETHYYEVYNQPNVRLVNLRETPLERITAQGVRTSDESFEFDIIIYATGFNAVLGGFENMRIRGRDGQLLSEKWANGPRTYLGLMVNGFPNLFTLVGPHNAASFCNIPRCIEQNVEWVTDLLAHLQSAGNRVVEPTEDAETEWTNHVLESAERMLLSKVDSWFTGINRNLGRTRRTVLMYTAGAPAYREKCDDVASHGYRGLVIGGN